MLTRRFAHRSLLLALVAVSSGAVVVGCTEAEWDRFWDWGKAKRSQPMALIGCRRSDPHVPLVCGGAVLLARRRGGGAMKKVLVVDDDRDCVDAVTEILGDAGYAVIPATSGDSGLEAARQQRPDLIVLDLDMPGKDGFDVLHEIRKDRGSRDIPVIILTVIGQKESSSSSERAAGRYVQRESALYIEKPLDPTAFVAQVKEVIGSA